MRNLSPRLKVIFDSVPDNAKVADIGTDHAYLPIALSLCGKCKSIIACDIKEKPLSKARENINKFKIINIDTRLGDGLSPIKEGEADTIIIAGMGGDVISHIISDCSFIKNPDITLLLQPMTSAEILRSFLTENSFKIIEEIPVEDTKKIYTVIKAVYTPEKQVVPHGYFFTGEIPSDTVNGKAYLIKQLTRINSCINDLEGISEKAEERDNYIKIKEHIENILEK